MGTPDFGVTADTALYQVFKRADGTRTYLAYNAGKAPLEVRFSDGKQLTVAPGALGRACRDDLRESTGAPALAMPAPSH